MSDEELSITINGRPVTVLPGISIASAVMMAGEPCRFSVSGVARAPLCGMGICMECRVTVDGVPHQRSCMMLCRAGMEVVSG